MELGYCQEHNSSVRARIHLITCIYEAMLLLQVLISEFPVDNLLLEIIFLL